MKVRFLLAEPAMKNVSFDHVVAGGDSMLTGDAYRAINPSGLVPCLVLDSGEVLAESNTILRFIAEKFTCDELRGRTDIERALISRWQDYTFTIESAMKPVYFHEIRGVEISDGDLNAAVEHVTRAWAFLDSQLEGKQWLFGRFTLAELTFGAQLHRYMNLESTRDARSELKNLKSLYGLLCERPSFCQTVLAEKIV